MTTSGSTDFNLEFTDIAEEAFERAGREMQREKPYLPLTCRELFRDELVPERELEHRCCMAVVSSCREMLG